MSDVRTAAAQPVTIGLAPSFGFGDRIGLATPGHVAAMQSAGAGIQPIFPQQSIREMTRTQRSPQQVLQEAMSSLLPCGWRGATGADADHLKTRDDVRVTFEAGFTFFTLDPSAHVDAHADDYDETTLRGKYAQIADRVTWVDRYRGRRIVLSTGTLVELTEEACLRAAVKYGLALLHALDLARYISQLHAPTQRDYEIELSVDETDQPTTLAEHYIVADQCLQGGMKLVSLAPRFVGNFEKGVDYKGPADLLANSLQDHAAIAQVLGPYKLSLHSGSDKLSMYPALARATRGRFHVKTAGTSYLEALRVVARHDPAWFRELIVFCRQCYPRDKATYHVSATLDSAPPPDEVDDAEQLERLYLELWSEVPAGRGFTAPGRQILHCTFGSVLTHATYGPRLRQLLQAHQDVYRQVLLDHFVRHLQALQAGL